MNKWKKFKKDVRGAVTVMVTLLLIPALLISGTGVDLARAYTARSAVQDANQMALNSVLTQYDAMLQDVYGLFAVAATDEELNSMVTEYVNACLYGTNQAKDPDAISLFSGSEPSVVYAKVQNLGQIEVLRHQIEEYAKFRAPVAIVDELLDKLDKFDKLKADAEVIQDKTEIENQIQDLNEVFEQLYEKINLVNKCEGDEKTIINTINKYLGYINTQMNNLLDIRTEFENLSEAGLFYEEEVKDCETKYGICLANIASIVDGYGIINGWTEADIDEDGEWVPVKKSEDPIMDLDRNFKKVLSDGKKTLESYISEMDKLVALCRQVDDRKATLAQKLDALEAKLDSGECSEAMVQGTKEDIANYRALLAYDVLPMGEAFQAKNKDQIYDLIDQIKSETIRYSEVDDNNKPHSSKALTLDGLCGLNNNIHFEMDAKKIEQTDRKGRDLTLLVFYAGLSRNDYSYKVMGTFYPFQHQVFESTKNPEFYKVLEDICRETNNEKVKNTESNLSKLFKIIQEKLQGFEFRPQGAGYYGTSQEGGEKAEFGQSEDWSDKDKASAEVDGALDEVVSLGSKVTSALDTMVDRLLLVTYDSEMFSCFADGRTDGKKADGTADSKATAVRTSMSGIAIDTHVNYFYQSELEFLYNGNEQSAAANLAAVAGTMLMVRFVFNYIATFTITDVKVVLSNIRTACSAGGPIGTAIGIAVAELTRVAFALGESVLDVAALREGDAVPLMKNDSTWTLSMTGMLKLSQQAVSDAELEGTMSEGKARTDGSGLTYQDYLRIFLLLKDENELAGRTKKLIQWNITNVKGKAYEAGTQIYGNEGKLGEKEFFDLSKCGTAYEVTTSVEMNFIFFSMAVFQKGVDGVTPPKTMDLAIADRRGY